MPATTPLPFAVQRIDHLVLRVRDLAASIDFYGALLGCAVVQQNEALGLVHLRAGASMIDLFSVDGPLGRQGGGAPGSEGRNLDHFCLRIDPFDEAALRAHLGRHGVPVQGVAARNFGAEGHGPSLYFSDLDGNQIELKGPSTPVAAP